MAKVAYLFPGQGSQTVGMGKEIAQEFPEANQVFKAADQAAGVSLSALCFTGPEEALKDTRNAQPAILTTSIALYQALRSAGARPADFVAGHSLGEYSALVASGALDFIDALRLVMERSRLMADADPQQQGTMAAVIGLDRMSLETVLQEAAPAGKVEAANFNCPGQIVVSGEKKGMFNVQELVAAKGGKFIPLNVSGPFHSSFMKAAADAFRPSLTATQWHAVNVPLVANFTARPRSSAELVEGLYRQIFSPVLWEDSLRFLWDQGVTVFVEVGPGKVLSGLVKKTIKEATFVNCEDLASLKKALEILKEV